MRQRLFFALCPDDAFCEELLQRGKPWLRDINGRQVLRENLHITLAFLGNVDEIQQACLQKMASGIQIPAFQLKLDRLAYWPGPQIAWAGVSQTPEAFTQLVTQLQQGAQGCGLQLERRPPVAHLTLKRKVTRAQPGEAIAPLSWSVSEFCLLSSVTRAEGPVYTQLQSWPLR